MILLLDIGNTHTHLGLANATGVRRQTNIRTRSWFTREASALIAEFIGKNRVDGSACCSVVPNATRSAAHWARQNNFPYLQLTPETAVEIGIDYPKPKTIGPDRLANAVAVKNRYGAPSVVVDFGTAVTFDVVDRAGSYIGGIIAPGLAAMTEYLHEKTALLPRIRIREVQGVIGKNTEEAMLIGAVHGYRGLVRQLIRELRSELRTRMLPVVATGGYAQLIAAKVPEITGVDPLLTLEGLRLCWERRGGPRQRTPSRVVIR